MEKEGTSSILDTTNKTSDSSLAEECYIKVIKEYQQTKKDGKTVRETNLAGDGKICSDLEIDQNTKNLLDKTETKIEPGDIIFSTFSLIQMYRLEPIDANFIHEIYKKKGYEEAEKALGTLIVKKGKIL